MTTLFHELAQTLWAQSLHEQRQRAATMPTVREAMRAIAEGKMRLKELGWTEPQYIPCGTRAQVVEAGSIGMFWATKDAKGHWWLEDGGDLWPGTPLMALRHKETDCRHCGAGLEAHYADGACEPWEGGQLARKETP